MGWWGGRDFGDGGGGGVHCPKSMRVFHNMVRSVDENNSNDTEYSQFFFRTMLHKVFIKKKYFFFFLIFVHPGHMCTVFSGVGILSGTPHPAI